MKKHLGKARYPLILLLAVAVVAVFVRIQYVRNGEAKASMFYPEPTAAQLASALIRAGLDAESLTAAGVLPNAVATVVGDVADYMTEHPAALELADADYASARQERDQLKRTIQSGRATQEQVNAYPTAATGFAAAQAQRQDALDDISDAGTVSLSNSQRSALSAIRGNAGWDLPLEFLAVDRTEPQWVQLRDCLANERIAGRLDEDPDADAQTALTQLRSNQQVATARANLDANLAVVELAWVQAAGE